MNLSYQHKKGPPKMVKDLKYGTDAHLRQSLLDITEIQNMNKIFIGRKTHYKVPKQDQNSFLITRQNVQENQTIQFQKEQFTLSPQENLQLIKRQRLTNMMKDKMSQMFHQQQVRKYKMRKPVLHKMLQQFKNSFRVDEQPKFRDALKSSQKNLQHIKINSKKRVSSQYIRDNSSIERSKFVSIQTGKPIINDTFFPSFLDFVQGKYKIKQEPFIGINISKIDNYLTTMITEPPLNSKNSRERKYSKDDYLKYVNRPVASKSVLNVNRSRADSPRNYNLQIQSPKPGVLSRKLTLNNNNQSQLKNQKTKSFTRGTRSKSAAVYLNPNANFLKSEESSKNIISAMTTYYSVKRQKTRQCDSIVDYLQKDRPLTSHIRRKNYTIIGKPQVVEQLTKYRKRSEEQRKRILQQNYDFYISLLKSFEHCKEEEIETSLKILKRLKQFFQKEYVIFKQDVKNICKLQKGDKTDFGVGIIKENLMEYARNQENFETQGNDTQAYEML